MLNIAVCDDNKIFLDNTAEIVNTYIHKNFGNDNTIIYKCRGAKALSDWIEDFGGELHILILDICLENNKSGIALANNIHASRPQTKVIFITSYLEKAADICEADFTYFVWKNGKFAEKLERAMEKAIGDMDINFSSKISAGRKYVNLSDILYFKSERKRAAAVTVRGEELRVYEQMGPLIDILPSDFYMCRRDCILNLNYVEKVDRGARCVCLSTGDKITIPKTKTKEFYDAYANFFKRRADK